jgi:hypothetical protein
VGEATAFPVAISMIADLFAPARRPRSIGIYQSSVFVGVVLGSILAGVLAAAYGWRVMFVICGLSGFVIVVLVLLTMREPVRGLHDTGQPAQLVETNLSTRLAHLFSIPGFGLMALGLGIGAIPGGVLPAWAPTFLLRSHGVALANVGALIGEPPGPQARRRDPRPARAGDCNADGHAVLRDLLLFAVVDGDDGRRDDHEFPFGERRGDVHRSRGRRLAPVDAGLVLDHYARSGRRYRRCVGTADRGSGQRCPDASARGRVSSLRALGVASHTVVSRGRPLAGLSPSWGAQWTRRVRCE